MIVEAAIGDAAGAAFEFTTPDWIKNNNDVKQYYQHPKWKTIKPGRYTDDTQRLMAHAELMLLRTHFSTSSKVWTLDEIAGSILNVFHRDSRTGYSKRMYNLLTKHKQASALLEEIASQNDSTFSGAAMGASVIGIMPDTDEVIDCSIAQANLTHNTDVGRVSAVAASLIAHYFYQIRGPKNELADYLQDMIPIEGTFKNPATGAIEDISMCRRIDKAVQPVVSTLPSGEIWADVSSVAETYIDFKPDLVPQVLYWDWDGSEVDGTGVSCVRAAVQAIVNNSNLKDLLQQIISWGGDTDSVAAIAMGGASLCPEMRNNLPWALYRDLEDGVYGHGYLDALNEELFKAFPQRK